MFAQLKTVSFDGIQAQSIDVQAQISSGNILFMIVGLPDKAVAESRERIRSALRAIGLSLPPKRITVNLAPADLPKEGSHYDLPIALCILAALGAIPKDLIQNYYVIGELGLNGSISHVAGGLPAAIGANSQGSGLICPQSCGPEAAWASEDMQILAPENILQIVNHFKGTQILSRPAPGFEEHTLTLPDLKEIKGQESAKRALEITAAGGHNLLMSGPPGSGKTMLASRLPSILPELTPAEMLEISMIKSLAGELSDGKLDRRRPFRAPHHSASMPALVGGGVRPRPGEVSLAHKGILFLDELPEFSSQALDALRQPLECRQVSIARANHRITWPSHVQLVAAMNPCKCGKAYDKGFVCAKGKHCAEHYQSRISGPLLDRIDIQIEVPAVSATDLMLPPPKEGSIEVRLRVQNARDIQQQRFKKLGFPSILTNAECSGAMLEDIAVLDKKAKALLLDAANHLQLTARGYYRSLRVARTLADLDQEDYISKTHIAEALSYRRESLKEKVAG